LSIESPWMELEYAGLFTLKGGKDHVFRQGWKPAIIAAVDEWACSSVVKEGIASGY
jgi:hypothetical protein